MLFDKSDSALFSPCGRYRYTLTRQFVFGKREQVCFVGLNPSTADAERDDPTIRRCRGYAFAWGFDRMVMLNLFAYRSTDPDALRLQEDPVGEDNDRHLRKVSRESELTVIAWGVRGDYLGRDQAVLPLLKDPHYLKLTRDGHPQHPLYLKKGLRPKLYSERTLIAAWRQYTHTKKKVPIKCSGPCRRHIYYGERYYQQSNVQYCTSCAEKKDQITKGYDEGRLPT